MELVLLILVLAGLVVSIPLAFICGLILIIYSVWRVTSKQHVCRYCGSNRLVDPDSPAAQHIKEVMRQQHAAKAQEVIHQDKA